MPLETKKKILFVCSGNICRSPLAHRLFEHLAFRENRADEFEVDSCGTGAWHVGQNADGRMRQTAKEHGLVFDTRARKITYKDLTDFDYILVMDKGHLYDVKRLLRSGDIHLYEKVALFRSYDPNPTSEEVPDPYYDGMNGFYEVYDIVHRTCQNLLSKL